ncbi:MAG: alcohol dehydrogenase catalytic domain-containing protein [Chloroflexi bacterium]|nr:alcohol dehydrogenase catalytic domain-containing protein [Chloroflexota bacterium]
MKQAMMTAPGKIEFRDVERPSPQDDQVVIQTKRIGVCGSDIHVFHGTHPFMSYPVVQGHEVSGVIAQVGRAVNGLTPGDPVVFMPQITCGECYLCRHGMYHICDNLKVMGFQTGGAAQEYFPIKAEMVLRVPASMSLDQAAMIEPVSVAAHALARAGSVEDRNVLVLGAGTIGNLVAQVAKASGAAQVMITDVSDYKLDKARECGLALTLNPRERDLATAILENFGPAKADLILECAGVEDTITQAISNARKGSTIVVVGVFGNKPPVDLATVQNNELTLIGTLMYQKTDYERAIELVARGAIHLNEMITHRFSFDQYLAAYQAIESSRGNYMKVMVELE